jgi:predicted RNA-binding protein associated with RNAse of E/G family
MIMLLSAGREVTVSLVKAGREKLRYQAEVLADDGTHLVVLAPFEGNGPHDLGYTVFEPGDRFTEHYWRDRWFSIKEIRKPDGELKGWYCDVARPVRIAGDKVISDDLDLDLWLSADGCEILRLDEDEFLASGLPESDPETADRARAALDELEALAPHRFGTLLDF